MKTCGKRNAPVIRIDIHTGEKIRFASISEAAQVTGALISGICRACRGTYFLHKGYAWEYEDPERYTKPQRQNQKERHGCVRIFPGEPTGIYFRSLKEAAESTGIMYYTLQHYLKTGAVDDTGAQWYYSDIWIDRDAAEKGRVING